MPFPRELGPLRRLLRVLFQPERAIPCDEGPELVLPRAIGPGLHVVQCGCHPIMVASGWAMCTSGGSSSVEGASRSEADAVVRCTSVCCAALGRARLSVDSSGLTARCGEDHVYPKRTAYVMPPTRVEPLLLHRSCGTSSPRDQRRPAHRTSLYLT